MNILQKELLVMFKGVTKILDENNIRYYAMGGTAIGGMREKGFIEGDDDIDILIDIKDFDKLMRILEMNPHMSSTFKSGNQRYPGLKILNNDIDIMENDLETKLFIDVFLGKPEVENFKKLNKKITFKQILLDSKILKFKKIARTEGNIPAFFSKLYGYLFFFVKSKGIWKSMIKDIANATEKGRSDILFKLGDKDEQKFSISEIVYVDFEDTSIPVTKTYGPDNFKFFGDIYEIPDKSQRMNHMIEIINKQE